MNERAWSEAVKDLLRLAEDLSPATGSFYPKLAGKDELAETRTGIRDAIRDLTAMYCHLGDLLTKSCSSDAESDSSDDEWTLRHFQRIAHEIYLTSLGFLDYCDAMLDEDETRLEKLRGVRFPLVDPNKPLERAREVYEWDRPDVANLDAITWRLWLEVVGLRDQVDDWAEKSGA